MTLTALAHASPATGSADLFTRSPANPLLTAADWPYQVSAVFNPAAAIVDGETVLLCRVEDRYGNSHLTVARSADGVRDWHIDRAPLITAEEPGASVENPRATWVAELGCWIVAYTENSAVGPRVVLASTDDFRRIDRIGTAMPPDDKDASLLSRHINGQFVLLHRPSSPMAARADIWLSRSVDLRSWSVPEPVLAARSGLAWDSVRIGMGPPPVETEHGWLGVYHGVKQIAGGPVYRAGLVLLDRDAPQRVLRRSREWILAPAAPYERIGDAPNVVFPTGLIADQATDELRLYYGAADCAVAMATARLSAALDHLLSCPDNQAPFAGHLAERLPG
jgi:beta-1,2-mannobiose phosphorylase / 1,2-beta-oligomannan phosphorylase